ncbi:Alpha/Beta hydrolase protein [Cadophora sp. MPI-SDFR-AT-0126]|nr:Alpha/Beta hydrolase protein [Leotiomycetes sp. MPI-SDFR-AT-0126]
MLLIPALVCGLYFGLAHSHPHSSVPLTVDLGYSKYKGVRGEKGITQWFGIRYAAAPVGDLRFRAPRDPPVNYTLQVANQHGPVCHSSPSTSLNTTRSEDCLFLDVYAPTDNTKPHPVYVYFQGGGFNANANPNMDATKLINAGDRDIVVVTFNYRVGPWGFLASKEVEANGDFNNGNLDQRKVLQWVQKNIHLFGGDPTHVTIGGASAGGASVDLHMTAYGGRDDKLFHAAAAESQSFGYQLTISESQYQYDALVKRVGCASSPDTLKCLRETPIETFASNNPNLPYPDGPGGLPNFMWSNTIDGTFTTDYTYNLFAQGKFVKIPSIFGSTTNEGTVFTPANLSSVQDVNDFLRDNFPKLTTAQLAHIDVLYPQAEQFPGKGAYFRTGANAYGEMRYNCPGIYISSAILAQGMPLSWNYHWDVLSTANAASGLGVTHAVTTSSIWGMSSFPDSALIPTIQAYWTSFIRSKDPNTYKLAASPDWETFGTVDLKRVLFPNDPKEVRMERVPVEQRVRCGYLSGIGASVGQ